MPLNRRKAGSVRRRVQARANTGYLRGIELINHGCIIGIGVPLWCCLGAVVPIKALTKEKNFLLSPLQSATFVDT